MTTTQDGCMSSDAECIGASKSERELLGDLHTSHDECISPLIQTNGFL